MRNNPLYTRTNKAGEGIWYVRLVKPRSLVGGKARSTSRSLKTTDLKIAEARASEYLAVWNRRNELLKTEKSLTQLDDNAPMPVDLMTVAYNRVYQPVKKHLNEKRRTEQSLGTFLEKRDIDIASYSAKIMDRELSIFEITADRILASEKIQLNKNSPQYREFVDAVAEGSLDALSVTVRQLRGEINAAPLTRTMRKALERNATLAAPGRTIMELFDRYAAIKVESGEKRAKGIPQDRMVIEHFADFVGKNRAVNSITIDDARDFRDTIARLPVGIGKRNEYRGLSLKQAVEYGTDRGHAVLSAKTRARYMSTVSPFFDWLLSEGYCSLQPFKGLHQKVAKGKNRRPSYTTDQLNIILKSPLFTGFKVDGKEHMAGNVLANDWRYWAPLICIFTGARITEVAQLRVHDITEEFNIWFFRLKEDEISGQEIKAKESRIVPIHSKLIELGLMDYISTQRKRSKNDGNLQIFPELSARGDSGRLGDVPSRFWREYLTAIGIKLGKDGLGTHSFRHSLSDRLRLAGFMDAQFGPLILGHADKSVTSSYGALQQGTAQMRSDMIEAVSFADLDFSKLHTAM